MSMREVEVTPRRAADIGSADHVEHELRRCLVVLLFGDERRHVRRHVGEAAVEFAAAAARIVAVERHGRAAVYGIEVFEDAASRLFRRR